MLLQQKEPGTKADESEPMEPRLTEEMPIQLVVISEATLFILLIRKAPTFSVV